MKKVAKGYIRVSTDIQVEEGVSLETQTKLIEKYCAYKDLELVKIYEDAGISGKNIVNRPGIQELLSNMKRGDHVIICTLCRLSRYTRDMLNIIHDFKDKGVIFVCLDPELDTSTPIGMAVLTILSAMKQLERETISKNTSVNMKRLAVDGKLRGKSPFGYKFVGKDKDLEPVPEQQEVISSILSWHQSGLNPSKISTLLNESGHGQVLNLNKAKVNPDPKFYPETVKRILQDHGQISTTSKSVDQRIVSFHKAI